MKALNNRNQHSQEYQTISYLLFIYSIFHSLQRYKWTSLHPAILASRLHTSIRTMYSRHAQAHAQTTIVYINIHMDNTPKHDNQLYVCVYYILYTQICYSIQHLPFIHSFEQRIKLKFMNAYVLYLKIDLTMNVRCVIECVYIFFHLSSLAPLIYPINIPTYYNSEN